MTWDKLMSAKINHENWARKKMSGRPDKILCGSFLTLDSLAVNHSDNKRIERSTGGRPDRVVCERELETEHNCNILTPTLLAITAFLFRSPGLLNRGPGGPASLGHVLIPASSLNQGPEGSLCWVLAFSTASCLQPVWSSNYLTSCLHWVI